MGVFKSLGKAMAYPFVRPVRDITNSTRSMAQALQEARDARSNKRDQIEAEQNLLAGLTPSQKFKEAYTQKAWTEPELKQQLVAVRRSRYGMLALSAGGFALLLVTMWAGVHWLVLAVVGPVAVVLLAGCAALAARYAWWEYQIQTRTLISFRHFLAREDLFTRVLWTSPVESAAGARPPGKTK